MKVAKRTLRADTKIKFAKIKKYMEEWPSVTKIEAALAFDWCLQHLNYVERVMGDYLPRRDRREMLTKKQMLNLIDMFNEGATSAELAERFNIGRKAVEIRLQRARKAGFYVESRCAGSVKRKAS